ncbi:LysR family transcriptional regulator [Salinicola acroporae]|uniref:HTH lysR-type domain-containing protein n=1 Tax=Salinicola acroporae TaxID=1541440 RepID=A0ABT6I898_9GAMM|nr:LysR family transcriptional regulator [Salinicola acroporae]MDH4573743.1 hypothetical protein [Salinicola acroporae]
MSNDSRIHVKGWLRIKHLVLLVTLDESRNLHATSRHMNMSQPAASKMLKDIETFFGMTLFYRQPRHMEITDAGRLLVRYARSILNDTDRLIDDLVSLREGATASSSSARCRARHRCCCPRQSPRSRLGVHSWR